MLTDGALGGDGDAFNVVATGRSGAGRAAITCGAVRHTGAVFAAAGSLEAVGETSCGDVGGLLLCRDNCNLSAHASAAADRTLAICFLCSLAA